MHTLINLRILAVFYFANFTTTLMGQFTNVSYTSQHSFTVTRYGKEIGWLLVSDTNNGTERILTAESDLVVHMLFSFEAKALMKNTYSGNTLTHAIVYRTLNGRVKLNNSLQLSRGKYKIIKGETEQPVTGPIYNTVVSIYFKEPVGLTEIFSEVYLCFIPIKKMAASVYQTELPDGGSMTYTYSLGKLTHITAKTSYGTVEFCLKK